MTTSPRPSWPAMVVASAYIASKIAVAVNTAAVEAAFGNIGGAALAAEGDTLHLEFLIMGTAMGGMRATSVLSGSISGDATVTPPPSSGGSVGLSAKKASWRMVAFLLRLLFRGTLCGLQGDECDEPTGRSDPHARGGQLVSVGRDALALDRCRRRERLARLWRVTMAATTVYGAMATVLFANSSVTAWVIAAIAKHTSSSLVAQSGLYFQGFSPGILPPLWLYNTQQLALGFSASGLALLYGGVVYATSASLLAWHWFPTLGSYGLGLGMSVGAWLAWAALLVHLVLDPELRAAVLGVVAARGRQRPLAVDIVRRDGHVQQNLTAGDQPEEGASGPVATATEETWRGVLGSYLRLAVPLGLSNATGLVRNLTIAALVSQAGTPEAVAYGVCVAFYQTLEIAALAASSCISAVVASDSAHRDTMAVATDIGAADSRYASRRHLVWSWVASRSIRNVTAVMTAASLLLATMPILWPTVFASWFGGRIYAYGNDTVLAVAALLPKFTWICFVQFTLNLGAMVVAALLHGQRYVAVPLLCMVSGNVAGVGWAVATQHDPTRVLLGGIVAGGTAVGLLSLWVWRLHRGGEERLSPPVVPDA